MCTSWKVRAMPMRARRTGPMPAMSLPRKNTRPVVGSSSPVSTLTSVVLPAPLGPTIEIVSPSTTVSDTPPRATKSPYFFVTSRVSSKVLMAPYAAASARRRPP